MRNSIILILLLCTLTTSAKKGIDRGITNSTFIPKGQWLLGSTLSYSEHHDDNFKFLVLQDITTEGYTFKVSPYCGYFFRDNVAAGMRVAYSRTYTGIDDLELGLGDGLSFSIENQHYLEHNVSVTGFLRTYIGLGSSKVFGLFNEARVVYSYGQGKNTTGKGHTLTGTYQTINDFQVGIAPGLTAFVSDFAAVEVSVSIMGFDFKWIDQKTNQVETGSRTKSSGNFKIDLFSINLGMSFYF